MLSAGVEQERPVAQGAATMEITVSRQDLLRELSATQSVVERKTTIPILSNFLLEASQGEGDGADRLTITATDLDQSIRTSCAAKVKKPGACTIPARKLFDYVKLLPDGDISIKLMENHWVQIRSGRSNTKMVGMARANFPQVPEFPETGLTQLASASLKGMISKTIFAISNEESRYTLNGALLILKAVSELQALLSDTQEESLDFFDDEHTLFFRLGHRVLTTRKLTGQFPNYEAVLPRDNNKFVVVRSEELMGSIQRVAQFADERSGAIKIRLEQNEMKISSSSTESGESEDTIETPYSFDPIVVGFNSTYLIDFLKAVGSSGEVRLEFKDAQSAGQMRPKDPADDFKYRYVIMPMRI